MGYMTQNQTLIEFQLKFQLNFLLALPINIYIYIYMERERERERESSFVTSCIYMNTLKDIQKHRQYNSYIYNLNTIDSHSYILLTL